MGLTITSLTKNSKKDELSNITLTKETNDFYSAIVKDQYTVQVKNLKPQLGWVPEADVKVDCTCADFMYRWSYVLNKHNALLYPDKYVDEPPKHKNPGMEIGSCKHVSKVLESILTREKTV
jgi:hypothetical protein